MDELSLYESILQLKSPWFVDQVELVREQDTVNVYVGLDTTESFKCPTCKKTAPRYDHRQRRWRHLDTCQYKTYVIADVPRVKCPTHGCLTVDVPWAEERSRFTLLFECMVIDWLTAASILAVCKHLRMSWNAVDGIMQRAVVRGQARHKKHRATHICVDEVSIKKGHKYMTIVSEPLGTVLNVQDGRSKESLNNYYRTLTATEKERLSVISMDMSPAYIAVTQDVIPNAKDKIAFDRFHVAQEINKAVDDVRRTEGYQLRDILNKTGLTGTRFLWLKNPENLSGEQRKRLKELRSLSDKTGRAWMLKEYAKTLWNYHTYGWAKRGWKKWCTRALRSRLHPFRRVAKFIKKNLWGIINAIVLNANNGMAESVNSKIKMIKSKARGFRNNERFKTAILFHCGGLSLYPDTHSNG